MTDSPPFCSTFFNCLPLFLSDSRSRDYRRNLRRTDDLPDVPRDNCVLRHGSRPHDHDDHNALPDQS